REGVDAGGGSGRNGSSAGGVVWEGEEREVMLSGKESGTGEGSEVEEVVEDGGGEDGGGVERVSGGGVVEGEMVGIEGEREMAVTREVGVG
ncbi:hypothetical protein, partial [Dermacoccus nishinomiyaensis]|uniref:hypothetical protein n=1 Tax=Dermacoccus nishinomiyaensis TaxID=1274 RepID=UPI001C92CCB3